MTIDHFTKEIFETNLTAKGLKLIPMGLNLGEFCYLTPVKNDIYIYIRSSVHYGNKSADNGKDSIRVYLVRYDGRKITMLSGSVTKWTNRVSGWSDRVLKLVENLKKWYHVCKCGEVMPIFVSTKSYSKGKIFCSCSKRKCDSFHWLEA